MTAVRLPRTFTHGEILRWRRVGGLTLAEAEYAPGQQIPGHAHANARFVLVLRGELIEGVDAGALRHRAGTLLFRHRQQVHTYRTAAAGATVLIVDMSTDWLERAEQRARVLTRSSVFTRGFLLHLAHRLDGEFRMRDEVSRLAIESLVLGLLAEASRLAERGAGGAPGWLERARALVDRHVGEPLPLARVAAAVGVHPVHLARTFRRVYGTTFAAYVRQRRVERARMALAGPSPLSDIAALAGFADQSHFSRLFKRHTGLTPSQYRLALRFSGSA
jgi:AraC family transcriptional regulator